MQFGRMDITQLASADLSLPADHPATAKILSAYPNENSLQVRVGCTGWGLPAWVGKIYPKGTRPARFLNEYARQFNCIEFNGTFYRLPTLEQVKIWKEKVDRDFKFCPKFTDTITHVKYLRDVQKDVEAFLEVCDAFGENLGPVFLMPHPQMDPRQLDVILAFMDALPADLEVYTEFRHPSWYTAPHFEQVFDALEKRKYGVVITDAAGRRDCVHMRLTVPGAFVRFVGNSLHESDYQRLNQWVHRVGSWMQQGLRSCYFFMHQHEEIHAPELCRYFIEELNKNYGTALKVPWLETDRELKLF